MTKVRFRQTIRVAILAMTATLSVGCAQAEKQAPAIWHVLDFKAVSPETRNCTPLLSTVFGLIAASDLAMPQSSLKIATGCDPDLPPSTAAAMIELKVINKSNVFEYFEGASQINIESPDDAIDSGAAAIFQAVERAASVWKVRTFSDDEICGSLKIAADGGTAGDQPVLLMTFDEVAERDLKRCRTSLTALAQSNEPRIALRAVGTIGIVGDATDFETLGKLTLSDMPQMPWAATHAIADIGGPESIRALEIIAGQAKTEPLRREATNLAERIRQRQR